MSPEEHNSVDNNYRSVPRHVEEGGASAPLPHIVFEESAPPLTAADICEEATRLVGGNRATSHGDKELNFQNIAVLWNAYLTVAHPAGGSLCAHDIGCMMELMKVARRFSGSFNVDDYVDAAGYAGCAGEIAAKHFVPQPPKTLYKDNQP